MRRLSHEALTGPQPIYRKASTRVLTVIRDRNVQQKLCLLNPFLPVRVEGAQVAFLFDQYLNQAHSAQRTVYKTFFANSYLEAMHGAIKLARHRMQRRYKATGGRILLLDPASSLQKFFDPLAAGPEKALVPNVICCSTPGATLERLKEAPCVAVMMALDHATAVESLQQFADQCKKADCLFVLDASRTDYGVFDPLLRRLDRRPDIFIWGESMTDYQVPFGAFSMPDAIFQPWSTLQGGMLHSSTYGGNGVAIQMVLEKLCADLGWVEPGSYAARVLDAIAADDAVMRHAFARYINPITQEIFRASQLDSPVVRAKGTRLVVRTDAGGEQEVVDCLAGAGSALRGHNPDTISEVIQQHNPEEDYWQSLATLLQTISGLDVVFPAVSGASAVEIAISLAMLANPGKTQILSFEGNYAGSTMIALNVTTGMPVRPFAPLYPDVTFIALDNKKAAQTLEARLQSGEVALVWFELIQGQQTLELPDDILELLRRYKASQGYYIGVDEILTGAFRTGSFLYHPCRGIEADLVTLSKGLSDMTFPIAATLCRASLVEQARLTNPALVAAYEQLYRNQLGAHIAHHGLQKALENDVTGQVQHAGDVLRQGLEAIASDFALVKGVAGAGLFLHLLLDDRRFPVNYISKACADVLLSRVCFHEGNALVYYNRFVPPLTITDDDINQVLRGVRQALGMNHFSMLFRGYGQLWRTVFSVMQMRRRARREIQL